MINPAGSQQTIAVTVLVLYLFVFRCCFFVRFFVVFWPFEQRGVDTALEMGSCLESACSDEVIVSFIFRRRLCVDCSTMSFNTGLMPKVRVQLK